ncbi:60s acidic ribosomal protein-domain-containing protein [Multifurca ochricompacta]|uniref:60s acidic ribosomal protein-domain-containing protein n=1 Tax=Multifurca ochricompacta TaxID=376703 RepID=A0AAD4M9A0_9AGAM|nr:60s acidic ribosomal protein-domain-containing protein [Multifurca ochricompacta]
MRYIAAYLLLKIAGKESPTASDIKKVIQSVGIETDDDRIDTLLSELDGKDINALIAEGSSKLASVPSGGAAVAAAPAAGGGGAPAAAAEAKAEEKKEEKASVSFGPRIPHAASNPFSPIQEESDDDMGFGLFD